MQATIDAIIHMYGQLLGGLKNVVFFFFVLLFLHFDFIAMPLYPGTGT